MCVCVYDIYAINLPKPSIGKLVVLHLMKV